MLTTTDPQTIHSLRVEKTESVAAPPDVVFESILDMIGPLSEMPDGKPFPMKIEPWPGGRWFRDLGNNTGHLWGHVQVIKPPTLLEICGPLFMSYAATSHVQYRVTPDGLASRLTILHTAVGLIPAEHRENVSMGWNHELKKIRETAEKRAR